MPTCLAPVSPAGFLAGRSLVFSLAGRWFSRWPVAGFLAGRSLVFSLAGRWFSSVSALVVTG